MAYALVAVGNPVLVLLVGGLSNPNAGLQNPAGRRVALQRMILALGIALLLVLSSMIGAMDLAPAPVAINPPLPEGCGTGTNPLPAD